MRGIFLLSAVGIAVAAFQTLPAFAATTSDTPVAADVYGRRGQAEPGDDRGNHGAGHPVKADDIMTVARRGQAEPGDDRGNHGAGHPVKADDIMTVARRGQAEPGDDRGNHGAGHPAKPATPTDESLGDSVIFIL